MKKQNLLSRMLLLCALVVGSGSVWADNVSITNWYSFLGVTASAGSLTGDNNKDYSRTIGGVTVTYKKATYQYVKSNDLRIYKDSKIIFTAPDGYLITEIDFGGTSSEEKAPTANTGTFNYSTKKWTGSANSITLSRNDNVSGYTKFDHATFTMTASATFAAGKTMISFSDTNNALDLTTANLPSGVAAYKMTAADASSVTLTTVNSTVNKNTGVILTGTAGTTYKIPVVGTGTDISGTNLLVASNGSSTVKDAYVLSGGKFHPVAAAGIVIPAGKAYLPAGSIDAHELDITFDDGEATGIKAVDNAQPLFEGAFYNLAGQRVVQPTKGLYIVNGKKVIIK